MDELDRLYRRLVHNLRAGFPELLARPFEVSQIYQQIVPYRTNRRELGFETNDDYELALSQLLSGVRNLLSGDPEMQAALRRELDSPSPDLAAYRAYATAMITLTPEPLRELMLRTTQDAPLATGGSGSGSTSAVAMAGRATESFETPADGMTMPPPPAPPTPPRSEPPSVATPQAARPAPAAPAPFSPPPPQSIPVNRSNPLRVSDGDKCRYCGGGLPEGRGVVFCPSCGHNLTVRHCPACSTELEVGWKFCITCGREVRG